MQYSPKLKKAAEEIKKVLSKYDIAGVVILHTPGFTEYLLRIDPSYSVAEIDNQEAAIKFKINAEKHHGGDKKLRDEKVRNTSNMMHGLSVIGGRQIMNLCEGSKMLDKSIGAEHFGGGHSSHNEQNN